MARRYSTDSTESEKATLSLSTLCVAFCCHPLVSFLLCGLASKKIGVAGTVIEISGCNSSWVELESLRGGDRILDAGCGKMPEREYEALAAGQKTPVYGAATAGQPKEQPKANEYTPD